MKEIVNMPELSSQPDRMSNPDLERWLVSAQGSYVMDWEQAMFDAAVADIFGFNIDDEDMVAIEKLDLLHRLESSDPRSWKWAWRRINTISIKIIFELVKDKSIRSRHVRFEGG